MITLDNKVNLTFSNMGLFDTDSPWIHPAVTIDSFELIFVTEGTVSLYEGERNFELHKGEMVLLCPGTEHGGTKESRGHTSFYWLHFYTDCVSAFNVPKVCTPDPAGTERTFKEIMHTSKSSALLCELYLAGFLISLGRTDEYKNKLACEVNEYIRINSRKKLTAAAVASRFGYSTDYVSRVYKREFGVDVKTGIIKQRLEYIESLLINTDYTIKEIAQMSGFEDENNFVKFFKYHKNVTPTLFRNRFFYVHMNNR